MSLKNILIPLPVALLILVSINSLLRKQTTPNQLVFSRTTPFGSFANANLNKIQVEADFEPVIHDGDEVVVKVYFILPPLAAQPFQYRWKLGQGVELIRGALTGKTAILQQGDTRQTVEIVVKGFSKENNHHIAFEVMGQANRLPQQGQILIPSNLESTFENVVKNVEKLRKEN